MRWIALVVSALLPLLGCSKKPEPSTPASPSSGAARNVTAAEPVAEKARAPDTESPSSVVASEPIAEKARAVARLLGRPVTPEAAIALYKAIDLRVTNEGMEMAPGTWAAYEGDYEGVISGFHMLRRTRTSYVAFKTSEDLSNVPDNMEILIVGCYESQKEFMRVNGSKARCPVLRECLIYR